MKTLSVEIKLEKMPAHNDLDKLAEAVSHMTWLPDGAVKLHMTESGPGSEKPITIMSTVKHTVKLCPDYPALCYKSDDKWISITYKEYYNQIKQAARGFIKLGLEPHHGVGIIGFNSPEWFISDLAAIFAGGFATGIYTTNSPEACQYVADNAACNIIVVENDYQLQKILQVKDNLPHLKAIVQYSGKPKQLYPDVYSWDEVMELGLADEEEDLKKELRTRIRNQAPNKCCALIYTSGTTGNPKGAMISHDNIIWTTKSIVNIIKPRFNAEVVVTYLPLSHVAGQLIDLFAPVIAGATVYFAQPDALKGSLVTTLREARPTTFLGVPRVWEKMQESIIAAARSSGSFKKSVASWAKDVGMKANMAQMNGSKSKPVFFNLANGMVFSKVRAALGMDRCRLCLSGAAPISLETLNFFLSLNIPIMQVYGLSESSGPHTFSTPNNFYIGSVGKEFPGAKTLLENADVDGNGEICLKGRHVFMGYLNMADKTREVLDDSGWLHSGDIGRKDKNGFLYITGRIKELIITAGGENIPPVLIEDTVKDCLPCVGNCMLIGDKRKFLTMLITLKTEVDPDTLEPKDKLSSASRHWCKSVGSEAKCLSDILRNEDEAVLRGIQKGIDEANSRATSRAQCIQKWSLLPRDFSVAGGELGPTLKLKRSVVLDMYNHTIESFYEGVE